MPLTLLHTYTPKTPLGNINGDLQQILDALNAPSGTLDNIGSTRGSLLYRGASGWAALTPGAVTTVLLANGAGADPTWGQVTYARIQNISATQRALGRNSAGAGVIEEVTTSQLLDWRGTTRGSLLYRGASTWDVLTPGSTANLVLTSNGAGADPAYAEPGGYTITVHAGNQATTTDSQTRYFGSITWEPQTTAATQRVYIPKAGTIVAAYIFAHAATAGSNESWSMYIRKNNSTDTLIATVAASTQQRVWSNTALSISVAQGDYIEIKSVQPAWVTNPANVAYGGVIWIR